MEKRSRKLVIGHDEHHQSGCIRGLINIFDFLHSRPQKLLAEKRHGSRCITGAAATLHEVDTLNRSCEMCRIAEAGDPCETATSNKMSVKELMEEEMFKQDQLTKMNNTANDPNQSGSHRNGHRRKNRWHANRMSFDLSHVNEISEKPTPRRHKSLSSLEIGEMMAELCTELNVKDADCLNHDQTTEQFLIPPNEDSSAIEEKLAEATKVFVNHFVDGKDIKEAKLQPSGELIDALQVLNSKKDVFLKLVQDPSSQLVKHVEKLVDYHAKPSIIEQEDGRSTKNQSSFWRKLKGLDRNLSKKQENPENVSTIVILKPASSEEEGKKVQNERDSTHLLFTEFTRKLKRALRKEQVGVANAEKTVGGEGGLGMASPTRDHFFIEKIPKKSIKVKSVGSGDANIGSLSKNVPRPLGEILSFSDYSSSPLFSPRKDKECSLISPRSLFPGINITAQQAQEETNHNPCSDNSELVFGSAQMLDDIEDKRSDIMEECNCGQDPKKSLHSTADKNSVEGYMEFIKPNDTELDKRLSVNTCSEPCSPCSSTNDLAKEIPLNLEIVKENEDLNATIDRSDWTSPISVLEPFHNEDDVSPRIKSFPAPEIQPRNIKLEDQTSPTSPLVKSILEFVLQESQLTEAHLLERFLYEEHLIDPSVFDEVEFFLGCRFDEPKLVYDLIEEVLTEICKREFDGIPSVFKSYTRLDLMGKEFVDKIWKGVHQYLQPEVVQSTLDHNVPKDLSLSPSWKEPRYDSECIGVEVEEEIFDELIEDTILSCIMNQVE